MDGAVITLPQGKQKGALTPQDKRALCRSRARPQMGRMVSQLRGALYRAFTLTLHYPSVSPG